LGYGIEDPSISFKNKADELKANHMSVKKEKGISPKSYFKIYKKIKELKPDVVIMHSTSLIFCVWIYSLFNKIEFISVEHQANDAKTRKDWFYSFLILTLSRKIVYLSEDYLLGIRKKFNRNFSGQTIKVINNGINTRKFKPKAKPRNSDTLNFSMISRMTDLRDHYTLIDAFSIFCKNNKYRLFLAGDGNTKKKLESYVSLKNMNSKVIFTGNLDEIQVVNLMQKTDIYVHSSLAETLSTSLLQVMSCKVPIIATDIPGINNLLTDGQDALLFKPKDVNQLVEKMECLINSGELRNELALNSYNKIIENYSSKAMFNNYKLLIEEEKV
jgi:glycosyltransferase involved in cell wall biosynthesis